MIQIAFINDNGEIVCVDSPAYDSLFIDGQMYEGRLVKHIPPVQEENFLATTYYDFETQTFEKRMSRPSEYHNWNKVTKEWDFNRNRAVERTRFERNRKLTASDWTQVSDSPLTAEQKAAWQTYRQALRDLPSTIPQDIESIAEILWPSPPS